MFLAILLSFRRKYYRIHVISGAVLLTVTKRSLIMIRCSEQRPPALITAQRLVNMLKLELSGRKISGIYVTGGFDRRFNFRYDDLSSLEY